MPLKTHQKTNMNEIKKNNKKKRKEKKDTLGPNKHTHTGSVTGQCELMVNQENTVFSSEWLGIFPSEIILSVTIINHPTIKQSADEIKHHNVDISAEFIKTSWSDDTHNLTHTQLIIKNYCTYLSTILQQHFKTLRTKRTWNIDISFYTPF